MFVSTAPIEMLLFKNDYEQFRALLGLSHKLSRRPLSDLIASMQA